MEKANITLLIGTTSLELTDITPAEALFLMMEHRLTAKGRAVQNIRKTGEVDRSGPQEMKRLVAKYGKRIRKLYSGPLPNLPRKFDELADASIDDVVIPGSPNLTGEEVPEEAIVKDLVPPPDVPDMSDDE